MVRVQVDLKEEKCHKSKFEMGVLLARLHGCSVKSTIVSCLTITMVGTDNHNFWLQQKRTKVTEQTNIKRDVDYILDVDHY